MSSFLWLLLYLAPLLGLTAALFAWFGWHWRGSDMQKRIDELTAQIDRAQDALHQASTERAAALGQAPLSTEPPAQPESNADEILALQTELKSAQAEARLRQDEAAKAQEAALALQNELKSAQAEARLRQDEATKAQESALALETEMTRLLADLEHLRAERSAAQAELASLRSAPPAAEETTAAPAPAEHAVPAPVEPAAPAKPKRKRATPAKVKAPAEAAPIASLREKITSLEAQLTAHQSGLATLTQERDDWQRRISKLEGKSPADAAGLGLARRSLADSDKRLATATAEIERLQTQTRVLLHAEESAAALSGIPDDDLTQIKGIKKITSDQLRAHGIRTWRQIALWDEDEKRAFSEILAFKNRAKREQWRQQARALHEAAHGPLT